jgi:hypothetical protein
MNERTCIAYTRQRSDNLCHLLDSASGYTSNVESDSGAKVQDHSNSLSSAIEARAPSAGMISGEWFWSAKCPNGSGWTGEFNFQERSDGSVNGTCRSVSGVDSCGALSGRVTGNKLTLNVYWFDVFGGHENPYEFIISTDARSMQGTESSRSHGTCTYQVKRR